jgi:hypothetical protein
MRAERVIRLLRGSERPAINDQGLRIGSLQFDRRLHQTLDRIGHIVQLIDHVGGSEAFRLTALGIDQLVEDQKQPKRLDRTAIEIVVAIFGIVEMEARELLEANEPSDDLLDIYVRRVMAEIDEAIGFG